MNGKRDDFTVADFAACAKTASMKRGRANEIIEEVQTAVAKWPKIAQEVGVSAQRIKQIGKTHRFFQV